jgi:hypothetical protein
MINLKRLSHKSFSDFEALLNKDFHAQAACARCFARFFCSRNYSCLGKEFEICLRNLCFVRRGREKDRKSLREKPMRIPVFSELVDRFYYSWALICGRGQKLWFGYSPAAA